MGKQKQNGIIDIEGLWYTAGNAAKKLSQRSNRDVKPSYVRSLARLGKVATKKVGERTVLYSKADIDKYLVEERGEKSGRAQHARAKRKPTQTQAVQQKEIA